MLPGGLWGQNTFGKKCAAYNKRCGFDSKAVPYGRRKIAPTLLASAEGISDQQVQKVDDERKIAAVDHQSPQVTQPPSAQAPPLQNNFLQQMFQHVIAAPPVATAPPTAAPIAIDATSGDGCTDATSCY